MPLMTVKHTRDAESMWLNMLSKLGLPFSLRLTIFKDNFWLMALLLEHLLVASLA